MAILVILADSGLPGVPWTTRALLYTTLPDTLFACHRQPLSKAAILPRGWVPAAAASELVY